MSPRHPRGTTLLEGMVSMAVLVIGILGAFQGILFASQQNSVAARVARSTSMGSQVRSGLEAQGRTKLVAVAGGVLGDPAICIPVATASAALKALTDGLDSTGVAGSCIVDLDAFDTGATIPDKVVAKYDWAGDYNAGKGAFRRVLVYLPSPPVDNVAVIISSPDTGRRVFVKQFVSLYDSSFATGNGTGVDL